MLQQTLVSSFRVARDPAFLGCSGWTRARSHFARSAAKRPPWDHLGQSTSIAAAIGEGRCRSRDERRATKQTTSTPTTGPGPSRGDGIAPHDWRWVASPRGLTRLIEHRKPLRLSHVTSGRRRAPVDAPRSAGSGARCFRTAPRFLRVDQPAAAFGVSYSSSRVSSRYF